MRNNQITLNGVIRVIMVLLALFIFKGAGLAQENPKSKDDFPVLKGPYSGQKRPGDISVLFARETLAKHGQLHGCPVFSPDGNEVYWSQMGKGYEGIFFMKRVNNKWTNPKKPSFLPAFRFTDVSRFSPDGQRLYFIVQSPSDYDENIMYVERKDNG
jgi:hypothetical protein